MSNRPDIEARIGEYAATASLDEVPESVLERARLVVFDTVGVCLSGAETDYVGETAETFTKLGVTAAAGGGSTVFATRDRRSPDVAALVNAAGGTALELDEGNQRSGHPGIHVVPPALAVAEHVGASGRELLAAVVTAYEASARLGNLVRPLVEGLHPHAEWAPVGAAIAAGRLLGFDADRFAEAVRIAVNPFVGAHWAAATEGATVRNFYTGVSCRHGLAAATMAASGVTGVRDASTRCLLPYLAADDISAAQVEETYADLGDDYYLASSYFKMHAACRFIHATLDAIEALESRADFAPDDLVGVTVRTFGLAAMLDDPAPTNVLSAKFSIPFAVASRLVTGTSGVDAFTAERLADDRIRRLGERVDVHTDPAIDERASEGVWGASVEIELSDGRTITERVRDARGGGDDPYSRDEVIDKFERLVGRTDAPVDTLRDRLLSIDDLEDVDALFDPLVG